MTTSPPPPMPAPGDDSQRNGSDGPHVTTEELSALIDGELTPAEAVRVTGHRERCASCQAHSLQLDSARQALVAARERPVAPPHGAAERAVQAALAAAAESAAVVPIATPDFSTTRRRRGVRDSSAGRRRRQRVVLGAAAAAAVLALAGAAAYGIDDTGGTSSAGSSTTVAPENTPAHHGRTPRHGVPGSHASNGTAEHGSASGGAFAAAGPESAVGAAHAAFVLWGIGPAVRCAGAVARRPPAGDIVVRRRAATAGQRCLVLGPAIAPVTGYLVASTGGAPRVHLVLVRRASRRYAAALITGAPVAVVTQSARLVGTATLGQNQTVTFHVSPVPAREIIRLAR